VRVHANAFEACLAQFVIMFIDVEMCIWSTYAAYR